MRSPLEDERAPLETDRAEDEEWIYSLDWVLRHRGRGRAADLLELLIHRAAELGIDVPHAVNTPYLNTIPRSRQPRFPGRRELERRIKSLVRWNAMAMVVRANREEESLGGHISTYASAATLYEIGFNHFFHGPAHEDGGDQVFFQGHASPGIYARAFLEGRLTMEQLLGFRRELSRGGVSSYPHPWLMPGFWQFPTVSMGLGPLLAIYQARFNRYLEDRGLLDRTGRVWAFVGDGEMDEPESSGALSLAGREGLDNLVFVINCNLQRLDGPVRGNGKIIQELETLFRGARWNVIKVIWGEGWDRLLERDTEGVLLRRMEEVVDGDYLKYVVEPGSYVREHFFGADPRLAAMVEDLSDEELRTLGRGGHDPEKVYAAYRAAVEHRGSPTVILAKTIKGYGLGEAGEGKNVTHKQKKLNEQELREFRARFGIPISDEQLAEVPFYRPPEESEELRYVAARRGELGGSLPARRVAAEPLPPLPAGIFDEYRGGSGDRPASTTMVLVRMLGKLMKDRTLGPRVVPIVPDEARTFGMDGLFRQAGIYSHLGQRYEPVDRATLLYYRESENGQILEEGITEAGAVASFIAAGTSYSTHGVPLVPFFIYYSMFGFQRVGDLLWAAGDMRARGFLIGGTAGRTTLAGEGLQHQDGNSHVLALPYPSIRAYDPAFAFEVAAIVEAGYRAMFVEGQDSVYYLTVGNENYPMPPMPEGAEEGILRGLYRFRPSALGGDAPPVRLLASGAIVNEALAAQELLERRHGVAAEVWSATSFKELLRDALATERANRLRPELEPAVPYVTRALLGSAAVVAATDYVRALPASLGAWMPGPYVTLGTDGFGRSDDRPSLRRFFEVDAAHIAFAALSALARQGRVGRDVALRARDELGIDPGLADPATR